jgi:hypothetical protein
VFETRAPSAKLVRVGDKVSGRIVGVRRTQHCEYKTNIPLYWEKTGQGAAIVKHPVNPLTGLPNDPKLQYEITLDTGIPDENGTTKRRLFVRGKRMENALRTAVQTTAGEDGLLIGGALTCTLTGTEPSQGGGSDAKLYTFTYQPPAAGEGRKPDLTPHLAGGTWQQPDPQPTPAFALRQQQQPVEAPRPVVTPYATTSTTTAASVNYDDQPPF